MFRHEKCCMFVSCVHPMAVLNATFLHDLQFVICWRREDARGDHTEEAYFRAGSHNCLIGSHECLIMLYPILLL